MHRGAKKVNVIYARVQPKYFDWLERECTSRAISKKVLLEEIIQAAKTGRAYVAAKKRELDITTVEG